MPVILGDKLVEYSNLFYANPDGINRSIIQVVIDDPDPNDDRYLSLLDNRTISIVDDDGVSTIDYAIDPDKAMYFIKYSTYGEPQVTLNFFVIE